MRSEIANVVETIGKSLALLSKRLDYETAPYRLEEFNAIIEDPDLWGDQHRAQKLMQDRQLLVDGRTPQRRVVLVYLLHNHTMSIQQ